MPSPSPLTSRAMIERLVAFDTTSERSNLAAIDFIRDYLAGLGVDSRLTFDDDRRKANLFATLGPADRPGVVLSGHTDVVPVAGQDWSADPFTVTERDGRLYGRGTADMKSFIAMCLAFAPEMLARGLAEPVHLAFSYDEEVGCVGVHRLVAELPRLPVAPRLCVVGEPTEMRMIIGHKGKKSVRCHVHGLECHSALAPRGVNAVEMAAEVIVYLRRLAQRLRAAGGADAAFDLPFTTVHTGLVHGGTALNIVPRDCWFEFEIRDAPGDDAQSLFHQVVDFAECELLPEMRRLSPDAGFEWHEMNAIAGLDMDPAHEAVAFVAELTEAAPDQRPAKVSFGTEAGLFQRAGIPTVVCGPGSIAQAHKPDEYITLDQVAAGERFIRRLMQRVCVG